MTALDLAVDSAGYYPPHATRSSINHRHRHSRDRTWGRFWERLMVSQEYRGNRESVIAGSMKVFEYIQI